MLNKNETFSHQCFVFDCSAYFRLHGNLQQACANSKKVGKLTSMYINFPASNLGLNISSLRQRL